jgi:RNA polymerase sigma-54 factor
MDMNFNLQLQQEQKLIMTPELQLAVKMLQLTTFELNEYINEQLVENPLLEIDESTEKREEGHDCCPKDSKDELLGIMDYFDSGYGGYKEAEEEKQNYSPLNYVVKEKSLWEYLKEQLAMVTLEKNLRMAAEYIIDNIDESGYLTIDIADICDSCGLEAEQAEGLVHLIQGFEPAGICARDIQECLLLQAEKSGVGDCILKNIIKNMLEYIGQGDIKKIAKENNISMNKAEEYTDIIRSFNPKPGAVLSSETTRYIVPEVVVDNTDGVYTVTVNQDWIPKLKINSTYKGLLSDKNSMEYQYVNDKFQSAIWIIKSIMQRMDTIKKVSEAILDYQSDFFENDGPIRPMGLKQISESTGYHESTVSRAIRGKYMQTPKGVFEIKSFFTRGLQSSTGEEVTFDRVKERIKEIISRESQSSPYSDQAICSILSEEGTAISRRTVAKYREEMSIPSSSKRKR